MAKAAIRRVRMFLAEKGLLDGLCIEIDLAKGENLSTDFGAKTHEQGTGIELDDGTCISETTAICRYFEEHIDSPKLLNNDACEKTAVEQWTRWVDFYLFLPIGMGFQHH